MSMFPETSLTLLHKLAVEVTGGNEAAWVRFFDLYTPAIRRFVEWNDRVHDPDDIVQEVYLQLVEIIRAGKYDRDKARFRTFLAMLIRRQLISLYRKNQARGGAANISFEALEENGRGRSPRAPDSSYGGRGRSPSAPLSVELSAPATQGDSLDLAWAKAKHAAAVEHVLTKVAMKPQSRQIYKEYVLENRPIDEISAKFSVSPDIIYKVKNRVNKLIEAVEMEFAEEK